MIKHITLFASLALVGSQAQAHTGSHSEISMSVIQHALSSPYHLAVVALLIVSMGVAVKKLSHKKSVNIKTR